MSWIEAITSAVDFADVIVGIGTIAGGVALALISLRGASFLLSAIKR